MRWEAFENDEECYLESEEGGMDDGKPQRARGGKKKSNCPGLHHRQEAESLRHRGPTSLGSD
jgi:hypothetical protein